MADCQDSQMRILISPAGSIRRTTMTLPVAMALRQQFPDAHIAWAIDHRAAPLVNGHRALNQTIVLPERWFNTPSLLRQTRSRLRQHRFDIAIDCLGTLSSAAVGWLAGAAQRIGPRGRRHGLSQRLNNTFVQPVFTHLTDRALELLTPLEIHSPRVSWNLPIHEQARRWAARWRRTVAGRRLAIFSPGADWQSKRWESDRYATVARYIRHRYRYRTVIAWGNETERQLAQLVVFQSRGAASLAPDTDLTHLSALIEQADLFLGTDSAPLHLAAALATPAIGLYGATRPSNSGPYGQTVICQAYEGGSRRHRHDAENSAMRRIGVDHVCQVVDQLEAKRPQGRAA